MKFYFEETERCNIVHVESVELWVVKEKVFGVPKFLTSSEIYLQVSNSYFLWKCHKS